MFVDKVHHSIDPAGAARLVAIAERQRRDGLVMGGAFPPARIRSGMSGELFFAARCALRYAAEARITGRPELAETHVSRAAEHRRLARALRA